MCLEAHKLFSSTPLPAGFHRGTANGKHGGKMNVGGREHHLLLCFWLHLQSRRQWETRVTAQWGGKGHQLIRRGIQMERVWGRRGGWIGVQVWVCEVWEAVLVELSVSDWIVWNSGTRFKLQMLIWKLVMLFKPWDEDDRKGRSPLGSWGSLTFRAQGEKEKAEKEIGKTVSNDDESLRPCHISWWVKKMRTENGSWI